MLRSKVCAPINREFKFLATLLQNLYTLGVWQTNEIIVNHEFEAIDKTLVEMIVEELYIILAMLKSVVDAIFDELLGQIHVVVDIIERHLRLNHPEL